MVVDFSFNLQLGHLCHRNSFHECPLGRKMGLDSPPIAFKISYEIELFGISYTNRDALYAYANKNAPMLIKDANSFTKNSETSNISHAESIYSYSSSLNHSVTKLYDSP